jgi:hypothetical protein
VHAEDGALIVAVADGAGSAAHSEQGARAAVEAAVASLRGYLPGEAAGAPMPCWEDALRQTLAAAQEAVSQLAQSQDQEPRQFAATLALVICVDGCVAAAQVGDGIIMARDEAGELRTLLAPQRGEYANETAFITDDDALARASITTSSEPVMAIAVMTDGLLRLATELPDYRPHARFFDPLFHFAAQADDIAQANAELAAFLGSERVLSRTDDDKTLVLAVRQ